MCFPVISLKNKKHGKRQSDYCQLNNRSRELCHHLFLRGKVSLAFSTISSDSPSELALWTEAGWPSCREAAPPKPEAAGTGSVQHHYPVLLTTTGLHLEKPPATPSLPLLPHGVRRGPKPYPLALTHGEKSWNTFTLNGSTNF